jgi:hypothetical protein
MHDAAAADAAGQVHSLAHGAGGGAAAADAAAGDGEDGGIFGELVQHAVLQAAEAVATSRRDNGIGDGSSSSSSSVAAVPGAGGLYWRAAVEAGVLKTLFSSSGLNKSSSAKRGTDAVDGILDFKFLAHHMPAVFFDGLLRVLNSSSSGGIDNSTITALQLPQCAISAKCAAALRQAPGSRCNTCGAAETCSVYWGAATGLKCDDRHPLWSGNLCYSSYFAPGLVGLLGLLGDKQQQQQQDRGAHGCDAVVHW